MKFLDPFWLPLTLLPVLMAVYAVYVRRKRAEMSSSFVSSQRLMQRLITQTSPALWWISTLLITLSAVLLILSLAQPINGKSTVELPTKGRKVYLAIDCSRSMLVKDVTPDRLTVAKTAALEIIDALPQEKIGLISFAGSAWMEAPLTTDHTALREAVLEMNQHTIPYGGSSSEALLDLVLKNQPEDTKSDAVLIIFSDGEFHKPPSPQKIKQAAESGLRIFTLGVGTPQGDYVPSEDSRDGLYRNREGRTILSSLKKDDLEKIARIGNGAYYTADDYSFINRLTMTLETMLGDDSQSRNLVIYHHIYYYFLIPAIILMFLAALTPLLWKFMKSITALFIGALLLSPDLEARPILTSNEDTLRKKEIAEKDYFNTEAPGGSETPYERKIQEIEAQEFQKKAEKARGENVQRYKFSQGVAEYKSEQFDSAIQSFSDALLSEKEDLQGEAHYNLGNSLYKHGEHLIKMLPKLKKKEEKIKLRAAIITQWKDSLDHYSTTLNIDPKHPTARENYQYVKEKLKELEETQKKQCEGGENGKDDCEGDGEGEGESGKKGGEGQEGGDNGWTEEEIEKMLKEAEEEGEDPMSGEEEGEEKEMPQGKEEDQQEELERRPGESPMDYAERKLREGSDAETGNLKTRRGSLQSPEKDW